MPQEDNVKPRFDIEKVVIQGFKCIREPLTISVLDELNILVGNNGAGKSTILEAIHLALTGMYRGEPIRRVFSETLFSNAGVAEFVAAAKKGNVSMLPFIRIEVFLNYGEKHEAEYLSGAINSERRKCCGFVFTIKFNEEYRTELLSLPPGSLKSLPIEYYDFNWITFGGAQITPRRIPVRSVMINPAGEWQGSRADERATRMLIEGLDEKHQMALAQDARVALGHWDAKDSLKRANGSLPSIGIEGIGSIDIAIDHGTADSWKRSLIVRLESVPYGHIGAGSQSMMQASIALDKGSPEKTTLLLFEEPENHLSHTNLNKLIKLIADGADGRKVIVTTHSSYVANVLGLENLQIVGGDGEGRISVAPLSTLGQNTLNFFKKLPGYDTLRLVLSRAAILVEGPSDELIVQLAYRQEHNSKLPIEDGIDVISVGNSFLRFLELSQAIQKRVLVLTDNDGKPDAIASKYSDYDDNKFVKIGYVKTAYIPIEDDGDDPSLKLNWNTLEAEMLRANSFDSVKALLGRLGDTSNAKLLKYMEDNKTETALAFFNAKERIKLPAYITEGLGWLDEQC